MQPRCPLPRKLVAHPPLCSQQRHLVHQQEHQSHQLSHACHQMSHPCHQIEHPSHQLLHPSHQLLHPSHRMEHSCHQQEHPSHRMEHLVAEHDRRRGMKPRWRARNAGWCGLVTIFPSLGSSEVAPSTMRLATSAYAAQCEVRRTANNSTRGCMFTSPWGRCVWPDSLASAARAKGIAP